MSRNASVASRLRRPFLGALVLSSSLLLAACDERGGTLSGRSLAPIPQKTLALMQEKGMTKHDAILIRSFKKESEVEIWKKTRGGDFALLKTYPICRWSGQLGPKVKEGDRQAPEGFYTITPAHMNPNSSFYLSFDTGFPNSFDRAHGRTGSHLMVHGACSSRGCFSMTDEQIAEIYALAREAFAGGQRNFQFQSYPFRMTAENLAAHRLDQHMPFWKNLKEGNDHFEVTKAEPRVGVCGRRYVFNANPEGGRLEPSAPCPELNVDPAVAAAVAQKDRADQTQVAELVAKGTPAIKLVYEDGDQHKSFKTVLASSYSEDGRVSPVVEQRSRIADVSRPEALAVGPRQIILDANGRPKEEPRPVAVTASAATPAQGAAAVALAQTPASTIAVPAVSPVSASIPATTTAYASAPAASSQPFYQRMLSPFRGLIGGAPEETPAVPLPAQAPAPPRRGG